jgi:hypothetical protein
MGRPAVGVAASGTLMAGCSLTLQGKREGDVLHRALRVVGGAWPTRQGRPTPGATGESTKSNGWQGRHGGVAQGRELAVAVEELRGGAGCGGGRPVRG